MINFDVLDSTQFEELCFELLLNLGFTDVDWRKGTGKAASPADRGRDIEAINICTDPDGSTRSEKWFVEVKHHKAGVSPTDIQGAVTWAQSEQPDCLLVICSNFLSNPAKDFLQSIDALIPRVTYWENKKLEQLLINMPTLQDKYNIDVVSSVLEGVHKNHLSFVLNSHLLEFDDFLEALSVLTPDDRDNLFDHVYMEVINPEYRPNSGKTIGDCYHPLVNYENFHNQNWSRDYSIQPHTIHQWVVTALNNAHRASKPSNVESIKAKRDFEEQQLLTLQSKAISDEEIDIVSSLFETHVKSFGSDAEIEKRIKSNAERYNCICDQLIPKLVIAGEKPFSYSTDESRRIANILRTISGRAD